MKIALIGFMGSGKSTVGVLLAKKLGFSFLEADKELASRINYPTVQEAYLGLGPEKFRELEKQIICEIKDYSHLVISTGGGVITKHESKEAIKSGLGLIIYLKARFDTVEERIGNSTDRPLFSNRAAARELYADRERTYAAWADLEVETDECSPEEIVQIILEHIPDLFVENAKNVDTKLSMLIGDPVSHSLSPAFHNSTLSAEGKAAQFFMCTKCVKPEWLPQFMKQVRENHVHMLAVTLPHKTSIIPFMDELDESAVKIGAVNTVLNRSGKLLGSNTDWIGIKTPLESRIALKGLHAAVIGAGGAARAACYSLKSAGAHVTIFNRTRENAESLANDFECDWETLGNMRDLSKFKILINCTSVGMGTDESPVKKELITSQHIVFDTVYFPLETRLLKDAKEQGAECIQGLEMFIAQAKEQMRLYAGVVVK